MKYADMTGEQKEAFKDMFVTVLNVKSQEEQQYTQQFFKLLILSNGGAIVLLATFMAALVQSKERLHLLRAPMIAFAIGVFLAALVYVPLVAVAGQATNFISSQVTEFFLNERDAKDMTGYGLNCAGRIVVFGLMISALICFGVGVYLSISLLGKLS